MTRLDPGLPKHSCLHARVHVKELSAQAAEIHTSTCNIQNVHYSVTTTRTLHNSHNTACPPIPLLTCSSSHLRGLAALVLHHEPRAMLQKTVCRIRQSWYYEMILTSVSSVQERQRLPKICGRRGARACPLGHCPAGMGRLHFVPGKAAEGQLPPNDCIVWRSW